jgi:hypothetical protein
LLGEFTFVGLPKQAIDRVVGHPYKSAVGGYIGGLSLYNIVQRLQRADYIQLYAYRKA